ncbi:MAG: class I SAM-dependent methyltransferase [Candidatus Micrarchaeota archaeon]
MEDKNNVAKASKHFGHMHGHGFHRMSNSMREAMEKPEIYLQPIMEGAKVVAELGCGAGFYCKYLQKLAEQLYCVDSSAEAIEEAKKAVNGSNVIFLVEDAAHTSIPSKSVDAILLANSFHDMQKDEVYNEIKRILNDSGKVVIIDWEKKETPFGPPLSIRLSKEDYISIFKDFKLEKEFQPSPNHYGLVLSYRASKF